MASLTDIKAPYNFVPLDPLVVCPDWADRVAQDVPFADGLSGHLDLTLEARTPVFVRDPSNGEQFCRFPDGSPGIPGTSIKGMLRNVIEIASFGRMDRIADRRFGVHLA